jgi:hypothetical protein
MTVKNRLRNKLVRLIQGLSADKLTEVDNILDKIEHQLKSKENTLKLAGSWKDLDNDLFSDLTDKLHFHRISDRDLN